MTAMRPETTSEHIARDMREGRFPEQSEPQMVADLAAVPAQVRVKPLDLSNALKHAFIFGWEKSETTSSSMEYIWTEYDPTESAGYARTLAALEPQPDPTCCLGLTATDCADVPSRHCAGSQPAPRDEVIGEAAMENLLDRRGLREPLSEIKYGDPEVWREICEDVGRAAIAAAKAVQP